MDRSLSATLDHVAVAVADPRHAERRWGEELGGSWVAHSDNEAFASRQLRYAGGGKLELLSPPTGGGGFVDGFLARFGSAIHHVTLKVPHLGDAVATVRGAGLGVVDVRDDDPWWHEGFLRPTQIGGLIVQLAWSRGSDEDWAARIGRAPEAPRADAATLLGPTIRHPDLDRATALWSLLGATVTPEGRAALRCTWPGSPLDVRIEQGTPAGPTVLRFDGAAALPAEEGVGPAVEPAPR